MTGYRTIGRMRRLLLPTVAAGLALAATFHPTVEIERRIHDTLLVIDITRSMNVRDMDGRSRLDASRQMLRSWLAREPCGTRIGLALFTERRSLTLLTPIDVCDDFESLTATMQALDWRMAWEGDSRISKGLNHAMARAAALDVSLIFVTDGQEAPPLPYSGPDAYDGACPSGIIVGAGGAVPAPIPKFDEAGREIGFYTASDVQQAPARLGPPPPDAASRPGYNSRNNPYGEADLHGQEHLSALREAYLKQLASVCGLGFIRLSDGPQALRQARAEQAGGRLAVSPLNLAPVLGTAALILLLVAWAGQRKTLFRISKLGGPQR
ncbi:VWA domain-containing protein [Breoghania sp.]|uniref:VWA domain-containing protein n=1 Tax=Breoghania sp. TaxID=2065378 RepID=UPI002AA5FB33|nr:VWA domain-containing protein [Breoghania sp.]